MADEQTTDVSFPAGWLREDVARATARRQEWQRRERRNAVLRLAVECDKLASVHECPRLRAAAALLREEISG